MNTPHDDPTVHDFLSRNGDRSAAATLTGWQWIRFHALLLLAAAFYAYDWKMFLAAVLFLAAAFYAFVAGYKLLTLFISVIFRPSVSVSPADLLEFEAQQSTWPIYTILLPLYHEPLVAQKLMRAMAAIDYPPDRLDIKLLLEEDDIDTRRRCAEMELPACVEVVVVPHSMPKTKPKACNHGLARAKGEFLVIFDAEDRPDPDQLKKAVCAFRRLPERYACLQAKLNYYNPRQNWLTRFFTLEYTAWFDLFLPGLVSLGVPIPLGGTSNHFRIRAIQKAGGWDPFNLTEDCDLGIRLHEMGFRTHVLESTTWEEANAQLGNWIRQRSRWVKGYFQTHLAHTRSHAKAIWRLGPAGYASFLATVGGLSLSLLLNPFFWAAGLVFLGLWGGSVFGLTPEPWQLRYNDTVGDLPGAPLTFWSRLSWWFWYAAVALAWANIAFILTNVFAAIRRRYWNMLFYAFLSPLYWVLISLAAWKGFLQLFTRPFYWEKTKHGLDGDRLDEGQEGSASLKGTSINSHFVRNRGMSSGNNVL